MKRHWNITALLCVLAAGAIGCSGGSACEGCRIDGACLLTGESNPDHPCQACLPESSAKAWSDNEGGSCSDGNFCTGEGVCQAGVCTGTVEVCDDGVACNGDEICYVDTDSCELGEIQCGVR